jgi:thioesterase domain-containing protein
MESIRRYSPRPVACPIVIFRAEQGGFEPYEDPHCGWGPWTRGGVRIVTVPGDHVTMFKQPNLAVTASRFREQMERSQ